MNPIVVILAILLAAWILTPSKEVREQNARRDRWLD